MAWAELVKFKLNPSQRLHFGATARWFSRKYWTIWVGPPFSHASRFAQIPTTDRGSHLSLLLPMNWHRDILGIDSPYDRGRLRVCALNWRSAYAIAMAIPFHFSRSALTVTDVLANKLPNRMDKYRSRHVAATDESKQSSLAADVIIVIIVVQLIFLPSSSSADHCSIAAVL